MDTIPQTQKAWRILRRGSPTHALKLCEDVPVLDDLSEGHVLVKIKSAALNPVYVCVPTTRLQSLYLNFMLPIVAISLWGCCPIGFRSDHSLPSTILLVWKLFGLSCITVEFKLTHNGFRPRGDRQTEGNGILGRRPCLWPDTRRYVTPVKQVQLCGVKAINIQLFTQREAILTVVKAHSHNISPLKPNNWPRSLTQSLGMRRLALRSWDGQPLILLSTWLKSRRGSTSLSTAVRAPSGFRQYRSLRRTGARSRRPVLERILTW